jgi:hypothetical protein
MPKNESLIDKKVKAYIENLFSGVGENQQLYDLKEELATNMKEKAQDYKARGMDEEQAFKEAAISMGDLSGLVDDMRRLGQNTARLAVNTTMTARISTAGIIAGVLLVLFGAFTVAMLYYMGMDAVSTTGTGIFIVAGGAIITYSVLTRETRRKYAMNRIRAAFYGLAVGILLFSIFTAVITRFATGEMFIAIGSLMVFSLVGVGLLLFLLLTGAGRRKKEK